MTGRLVVLASGEGTTLQAVLDACRDDPGFGWDVVGVVVDRTPTGAARRAGAAGVPVEVVSPTQHPDRGDWDVALAETVAGYRPGLVFSAGFQRILGAPFLARFPGRIINTHPSLLPRFPGRFAVRDTLAAGGDVAGATVHWVDAGVDTGPVIAQATVRIYPGDDVHSLTARIQAAERPLVVATLTDLAKELA